MTTSTTSQPPVNMSAPPSKRGLDPRTFRVFEWVPYPIPEGQSLPNGWTRDTLEADLDRHALSRLVTDAGRAGFPLDRDTLQRTQDLKGRAVRNEAGDVVNVHPDDWQQDMRLVEWTAIGYRRSPVKATEVSAVAVGDGSWVAVLPHATGGIISVKHGLNSESVAGRTFREDGGPIGHVETIPVSPHEVEVLAVPETARIVLTLVTDDTPGK